MDANSAYTVLINFFIFFSSLFRKKLYSFSKFVVDASVGTNKIFKMNNKSTSFKN